MKINSFLSNRQGVTSIEYAMLAIVFTVFIAIYLINKDGLSGLMLRKGNDVTNIAVTQLGGNAEQGRSYHPIAMSEICIKHVPESFSTDEIPCMNQNPFINPEIIKQEKDKEDKLKGYDFGGSKEKREIILSCWNSDGIIAFVQCVIGVIHRQIKERAHKVADKFKNWINHILIVRPKYPLPKST